jgi:hypothetical protein
VKSSSAFHCFVGFGIELLLSVTGEAEAGSAGSNPPRNSRLETHSDEPGAAERGWLPPLGGCRATISSSIGVALDPSKTHPDQVRRSRRFGAAKLFSRWFSDVKGGKHVVVVVVSSGENRRHWIITAYITRKLAEGEVEWERS